MGPFAAKVEWVRSKAAPQRASEKDVSGFIVLVWFADFVAHCIQKDWRGRVTQKRVKSLKR